MENEKMLIMDKDGIEKEADVLAVFNSTEFNKDYIIYTFNEKQNEMIKILASTLIESEDNYVFEDIATDAEWDMVKKTIKELAKEGAAQ